MSVLTAPSEREARAAGPRSGGAVSASGMAAERYDTTSKGAADCLPGVEPDALPLYEDEEAGEPGCRAAPCFNCSTEPRLEGHVVCSGCHDETRCRKCHPSMYGTAHPQRTLPGSRRNRQGAP